MPFQACASQTVDGVSSGRKLLGKTTSCPPNTPCKPAQQPLHLLDSSFMLPCSQLAIMSLKSACSLSIMQTHDAHTAHARVERMFLLYNLHTLQFKAVHSHFTERCCNMLLALSNVSAEVSEGVKKGLFSVQFKIPLVAMPQPCLPV